jgi:homoserine O-acetyltransferase
VLYSNYFSKKIFQELSNDEIDVLMDDFVDEGLFLDIYDLKFRNDAILEYDVEDKLNQIKAKSLFISTESDIYFTPKFDLDPLKKLVKDSKIVLLNTEFDFGDDYKEYRMAEEDIGNFLKQFKE